MVLAGNQSIFQEFSEHRCKRYLSTGIDRNCRFPSANTSVMTERNVVTGVSKVLLNVRPCTRFTNTQTMDAACTTRPIDELKRVFPTPFARADALEGWFLVEVRTNDGVADGPNDMSLARLDVEKRTVKVPPLIPEVSTFWSMV